MSIREAVRLRQLGAPMSRAVAVMKRDFSTKQREKAADKGAALPDGSFPIFNQKDLDAAVKLVGHAKNPEDARKHIVNRAKKLKLSLPDSWKAT